MVKDMWVTHGMRRAMCQATKRELRVSGGRYFGKYLVWEARTRELVGKKGTRSDWSWRWREKKEGKERKKERRERRRREERKETGGFFLRSIAFRQSKFV